MVNLSEHRPADRPRQSADQRAPDRSPSSLPVQGWVGLGLIALFWPLSWLLPGMRTQWTFFPLWLGYCFFVDGLVGIRKGASLLTRNSFAYGGLFLASMPVWWLFELINYRTDNWRYLAREEFSDPAFFLLSSISFSIVIPAVFGTAELAGTFGWVGRLKAGPRLPLHELSARNFFSAGVVMMFLTLLAPRYFFPLVWVAPYFLIEALNLKLRNRTLLAFLARGDWRPVAALATGSLICGFWWEFWNYYSFPKWVYNIPYVGFVHIFEMPILGYLGYLPFSLELFAMYHFLLGLTGKRHLNDYLQLTYERVKP